MWEYFIDYDRAWLFRVTSNRFIVQITGGSIIILDRNTQKQLKRHKGYAYLYTGDISPDEKLCFALENEKYFLVYSMENYELIKRVTLPRSIFAQICAAILRKTGSTYVFPEANLFPTSTALAATMNICCFTMLSMILPCSNRHP